MPPIIIVSSTGHLHHLGDGQGHDLHHPLHHAEVVEHGHERGEEDDRRQGVEDEDEAVLLLVGHAAEDHLRAGVGEFDQLDEDRAQTFEDGAAPGGHQHEGREGDLQGNAGADQLPVDRLLVARERPRDADQHRQSEQAESDPHQSFHLISPGPGAQTSAG
jgi:hypothetical protein